MRILFLCHSFNSLAQRLFVVLSELGHEVSVEYDINDAITVEAVELWRPELIIAPFLKRAIPESVWRRHVCLIVHPGVPGDRGPSALDWAILNRETQWGVTVLQANAEMDAGDVWATATFAMRDATKASLYRSEVADAAASAVTRAVARFEAGNFTPLGMVCASADTNGRLRPLLRQRERRIDWSRDETATVLRKIRSADGFPGLLDERAGRALRLFNASCAPGLAGRPGDIVATSGAAVGIATVDGGVWVGHLRDPDSPHPFKLPATLVLGADIEGVAQVAAEAGGWHDLHYEEIGGVGILHFPFYNGAMSTDQCDGLRKAFLAAAQRDTRVIVLAGGPEFWSNGMDLNRIEAANSAADESWRNINAMDDLAEAIITMTSHITVAALRGNAGAGGVFLARAADQVWTHAGVVLNPYYKDMGNLYGSEYWTYLLPRCCGQRRAEHITASRLPIGAREALELGLVDRVVAVDRPGFDAAYRTHAATLAARDDLAELLEAKARRRAQDEAHRPLADYRGDELARMRMNFYGFDPSYHIARYNFVYKVPRSRTPVTIARHRRGGRSLEMRNAS